MTVVASRPETRAWCEGLGAHHVLDHSKDLVAQAGALGIPFPRVFSTTETPRNWNALCEILAPQGVIGLIDDFETLDILKLKPKSARIAWEFMFARPLYQTPDMDKQHHLLNEVSRFVDEGRIKTTLGENLGPINAANLKRGHRLIESGSARGKIVLEGF